LIPANNNFTIFGGRLSIKKLAFKGKFLLLDQDANGVAHEALAHGQHIIRHGSRQQNHLQTKYYVNQQQLFMGNQAVNTFNGNNVLVVRNIKLLKMVKKDCLECFFFLNIGTLKFW